MKDKDIKIIRKEIATIKKSLEEVERRLDKITMVKTADEIYEGPVSEAP
jgi:prefoldin subunit 5